MIPPKGSEILVSAHQAEFPIATMCRVLGNSSSGYYAWRTRSPSRRARLNTALTETVRKIHAVSHGTYGALRVHAELVADGVQVGKNRVARLMHDAGVAGVSRRKFAVTTVRDGGRQAPDLVDRTFTADAPNELWVADITYIPTWAGFLYLAVVLDVFQPPDHRLVDVDDVAHHSRARCVEHGAGDASSEGCHPSLGSRLAVHVH